MRDNQPTVYARKCVKCEEPQYILAKPKDVNAWMDGARISDAFPYLTPDERELLISGICPSCWIELFGGVDDAN